MVLMKSDGFNLFFVGCFFSLKTITFPAYDFSRAKVLRHATGTAIVVLSCFQCFAKFLRLSSLDIKKK